MNNELIEISRYRFDCANEDLTASRIALEHNMYKNAVNRSYYAIFHAIRAVNALEGFDSKKHSGVIAFFNQHFVKTGIFDIDCSKIIDNAFRIRNNADYEDFFIVSIDDAKEQIENAERFLKDTEKYLKKNWA
jgi:uncharacterized protein (UPF0332 family)